MKTRIMIVALVACAYAGAAWTADAAAEKHPKERLGVASGAVAGGLAGGPLGVVFGAALGGWLGDFIDTQGGERDDYARRWHEAQAAADDLNALVQGSEDELRRLRADYRRETDAMRDRVREALDVQVLFKTGASDLADESSVRLRRLAELVAGMDGMLLRIEGHADARGEAEFNEQLSAQRAATVRDVLLHAGIPVERIVVDARGEADAVAESEDVDGMALDRRVQLTLIPARGEGRVAQE
jgi:outer membrane protein OmpA-like peptidoglycan-associated protein